MVVQRAEFRIWAAAVLLALACSTASIWQLHASREAHLHAAEQLALSLSNAAAQRIAVSLRSMDMLLTEVTEKVKDPATLPSDLSTTLRTKLDVFPELDSIGLVDEQGWLRQIIYRGGPKRMVPVHIADTPHIRAMQETWREGRLFLSPPVPELFTLTPVILLTRPLVDSQGIFHGSAGLAVKTDFIDAALASVVPKAGDAAGAFSPDGVLFSRSPVDKRFTGRSIRDSGLFRAYTASSGTAGTERRAVSFSDGIERIVAFTPVPGYDIVAAVGIARAKVVDRWQRELWVHGGIQSLFAGIIFALAFRLSRSERRRRTISTQLLANERAHVELLERAVKERTAELNTSLAALAENEERFRRIVDISPFPLVLTRRADNGVVYINERASETFGVPQNQAADKVAPNFWVHAADRAHMIDTLTGQGMIRNQEALLKRGNGEAFTALLSAATVTLGGEALVLTAVLDITERKRLEEDLARSNRDLEQFSYAVSHDLQEPLRMVSSYLALLERRYRDQLDSDAHEFIGFAVDGAQRMSRMISDLLEYSRVHRRGNPLGPVDLNDALSDALANLSAAIAESGAHVEHQPLPTVQGDASQLMRVFQNLVGNAIKYRRPNTSPTVTITAAQDDGQWVVSVADDGIGIDPAATGRLFQVFQRLNPRDAYEGSGVGLAVCRRILERHGGRIWVDSAGEGQGCTFRFSIPAIPPTTENEEGVAVATP